VRKTNDGKSVGLRKQRLRGDAEKKNKEVDRKGGMCERLRKRNFKKKEKNVYMLTTKKGGPSTSNGEGRVQQKRGKPTRILKP